MVLAVVQHHKEGQRCLGWKGTPANQLPASEEPHLPGSDAQEATGDGTMGELTSKPPKQEVIDGQGERLRPVPALTSAT